MSLIPLSLSLICRCTIEYREISRTGGLAAGNINFPTPEGSAPRLIERVEFAPAIVQKTLEKYEAQIVTASVENAIIVTTAGEVYHCSGDVHGIPKYYFGQLAAKLEGAHVTHNHPPAADENDHTFSDDDLKLFQNFKLARLRGVDEKFVYELNRNAADNELARYNLPEIYALGLNFEDYHVAMMLKTLTAGFGYRRWSR